MNIIISRKQGHEFGSDLREVADVVNKILKCEASAMNNSITIGGCIVK